MHWPLTVSKELTTIKCVSRVLVTKASAKVTANARPEKQGVKIVKKRSSTGPHDASSRTMMTCKVLTMTRMFMNAIPGWEKINKCTLTTHRFLTCKLNDKSNQSREECKTGFTTNVSDQLSESIQLELQCVFSRSVRSAERKSHAALFNNTK